MDLSPEAQRALAYWGPISRAASEHMTTRELWGAIRAESERLGLPSPGVTVRGVSQLRGLAGGIESRAREFNTYSDSRVLRGSMAAQAPWSRPLGEQRALPQYQIRFQHQYTSRGEQVTEWRTTMIPARLPRTVGDLRDLVAGDALQLARKYGVEHLGIGDLQVLAV